MLKTNLKKIDIVKNLSKQIGYSHNYSKKIVDDIIDIIINNIKTGKLNLKNIGTFKIIYKKERLGRNPKTLEEFKISARKSVSFLPSKHIKDNLNNYNE